MYSFSLEISNTVIVLLACAAAMTIPVIIYYMLPALRVSRASRIMSPDKESYAAEQTAVSVVVYASDQAESLRHLLPSILGQNYRAPFEVIVVNEGRSDSTADVVQRLRLIHDNLYLTYTPDGARQLSRKKLALMIGIKAARYPVVVHTTASAVIDSEDWLRHIVAPFGNKDVEVVLGHSSLNFNKDNGFGARSRAFNSTADDLVWLDAALRGKPYRGTELNLAYTRDLFFRNRGFSRSLNLKYGDDDIFINEITTGRNTAVVLEPESIVRRSAGNIGRTYRHLRSRYFFTRSRLPKAARLKLAAGTLALVAMAGLCVFAAILGLPNLTPAAIAAFLLICTFLAAVIFWRRAVKILSGRSLTLTLPWMMITRPIANLTASVKSLFNRKNNYTWH